jgi:hypothetical protein
MTASSGIMRISSNFHILFKKCWYPVFSVCKDTPSRNI